jgi:sugar porter (SP) family MFS transporter
MMNGLQSTSSWKTYFNNPSGSVLGVVNAAQSIGSVVVLPVVGLLSDRIGRRWTLFSGIVTVIIASTLQAASVNYAMFVIARLLVGVGGMLVTQPSPMLISELCYPTHRGKYTSLFWTIYYFGAILAAWSTFGTQKHIGNRDWAWRAPSILQAAYPIIQLCFFWAVPESPRWLIANGRSAQARQILARFHTGGDSSHELVEFEMTEISRAIELERQAATTKWSSLVSTPGNRKRTLIAVCVGAFAQWNGVAVVSYYLTLVLDTVGVKDPDTQTLINGILQIFNFIAAASAAFLVDRLGRRTLFIWSGIGMLISFVIWTACSAVFDSNGSQAAGIIV